MVVVKVGLFVAREFVPIAFASLLSPRLNPPVKADLGGVSFLPGLAPGALFHDSFRVRSEEKSLMIRLQETDENTSCPWAPGQTPAPRALSTWASTRFLEGIQSFFHNRENSPEPFRAKARVPSCLGSGGLEL